MVHNITCPCLLRLKLRCVRVVRKLPHFTGPLWGALLKTLNRELGLEVVAQPVPFEWGATKHEPGEHLYLGLSFAQKHATQILALLARFNSLPATSGHFQPGRTLLLEEVHDCISGRTLMRSDCSLNRANVPQALRDKDIEREVRTLMKLEQFTLRLATPLRLPRPEGAKAPGRRFCDPDYLRNSKALQHVLSKVRDTDIDADSLPRALLHCTHPQPVSTHLDWLDTSYGSQTPKILGGTVGEIRYVNSPDEKCAHLLVRARYQGIGKNRAFGFGYATIPQLDNVALPDWRPGRASRA